MTDERKETGPGPRGGRPGRGTRPRHPERPCLNCGDPTAGEYCPTCGQRKVEVRVSLRAMIMDVLEDQFILDRRLPRTLSALLFRPGRLTVEYVNGRMVSYIHPFRLYLVTSLLFFVLLSFFSLRFVRSTLDDMPGGDAAAQVAADELDEALTDVRVELADTTLDEDERTALRSVEADLLERRRQVRLDSATAQVADLTAAAVELERAAADTAIPAAVRQALAANRAGIEEQLDAATARRKALRQDTAGPAADTAGVAAAPAAERDRPRTVREVIGWGDDGPDVDIHNARIRAAAEAQMERIGDMTPREAAEALTGTFFNYVPTLMFILLPVFAVVLKLLYIRRRRYYAEHFVFLLHVHSVVFILATVLLLLRGYLPTLIEVLLGTWVLVYIYLAMKRVYGQGWLKTFVKYWTLGWMYFWILVFSAPLILLATLLLF